MARIRVLIAALCAAAALVPGGARADEVADFYKGKSVRVIVGVAAGGLYSSFAQILARHMGKHMPGNPNFIVENQLGAGGMVATNSVYNALPKDGTVVTTPLSQTARRVVLGDPAPKYDPRKFHWLGGWGEAIVTCSVWKTAAANLEEAKQKEVVIGAFDAGSLTYTYPLALNTIIGTKFKIVLGYSGGNDVRVAMERNEAQGLCAQYDGWKSTRPQWLAEGKLAHLLQFASKRSSDIPDVPTLGEFAKTDEDRQIMKFIEWGIEDRAMVVAPGVPLDRVAALEKAYMATLNDPEFLAEAAKQNFEIQPISGKAITDYVNEVMALKPEIVAKIKKVMGIEEQNK
jgi:tripartite-type tricarboxylate transporter receptor subunit TctC